MLPPTTAPTVSAADNPIATPVIPHIAPKTIPLIYFKAAKVLVQAGNDFNKITDGGKNMFGVKSLVAATNLNAAKSASQIAHAVATTSKTVAKASIGAPGTVVRTATQNSMVDKIKNFFSF